MTAEWGVLILGAESAPRPLPESGRMVLGSSSSHCDLQVEGQGVDETHCAIGRLQGGGWAVKDLGSRYGTLVNGSRVESGRLSLGDELVLGSRKLRIVDMNAASRDAITSPSRPMGRNRVIMTT